MLSYNHYLERFQTMDMAHKKKKRTPKKRKQRIRFFRNVVLAGITAGTLASFGKVFLMPSLALESFSEEPVITITDYTEAYRTKPTPGPTPQAAASGPVIDHRQVLEDAEIESKLADLALTDPDIAEIYARRDEYPEEMMMALAFNQEMTEFVKGYLSSDGSATGGINEEEACQSFPLFLQWDTRWGYVPYGGMNIGMSGCGPTCLSMVIFALTGDASATPDALAAYSMENGYYMEGTGTAWALMTDAAYSYGLRASELGLAEEEMKYYLGRGCPIICSMRPGDFTLTGHFIVIYGYDGEGFLINDPNSRERSSRHWDYDTLHSQIKNLWYYSRP